MKNVARLCFRVLGAILAIPFVVLLIFKTLDHWDVLSEEHPFFGLDFVPVFWLVVATIPALLLIFVTGMRRTAGVVLAIVVVGLMIAGDYSPLGFFLTSGGGAARNDANPVIVAAMNVQYFASGERNVFRVLARMNADVYLLSEVALDDSGTSILRSVMPGYHELLGHTNSTAILSRFPIVEGREIELPSHEASLSGGNDIDAMASCPSRSFVHAVIDVHGQPVHVISVRFLAGRPMDHSLGESLRWGRYLLREQKKEVGVFAAYVRDLRGPVIFGGDLNAPPRSKTMRPLEMIASDAYLVDHWMGDPTFRTERPSLRLDYLFSMNGVRALSSERINSDASDHFPVLARFMVEKQEFVDGNHSSGVNGRPTMVNVADHRP